MPGGHLLGKGWPLGSRLWCLTVSLSLSHWYPESGVVLDCIDSWSLHPYLLWNCTLITVYLQVALLFISLRWQNLETRIPGENKLKYRQIKKFLALNLSDVVFIMLINVKMPTSVGILTFMSMTKFYFKSQGLDFHCIIVWRTNLPIWWMPAVRQFWIL